MTVQKYAIEERIIRGEPFSLPIHDEVEIFGAAYAQQMPVLLKGPTGCGKTRFIEYMAYVLGRPLLTAPRYRSPFDGDGQGIPLVTVACHEALTARRPGGRHLLGRDGR